MKACYLDDSPLESQRHRRRASLYKTPLSVLRDMASDLGVVHLGRTKQALIGQIIDIEYPILIEESVSA